MAAVASRFDAFSMDISVSPEKTRRRTASAGRFGEEPDPDGAASYHGSTRARLIALTTLRVLDNISIGRPSGSNRTPSPSRFAKPTRSRSD